MKCFTRHTLPIAAAALLAVAGTASAAPILCPDGDAVMLELDRQASVDPALACEYGLGNPDGDSFFGGDWSSAGELNGADGTSDYLTVDVTSGSWGSSPIEADWFIDASFWEEFGRAVLSAHVGNGNGDPDWFAWELPANVTSGTFAYIDFDGKGGGLSNIKLWGKDAPPPPTTTVPEPGTLGLLGIAVLGVGLVRRRKV